MTVGPEFYANCEVEGGFLNLKALTHALDAIIDSDDADSHHSIVWLSRMIKEEVEKTYQAFEALPAARAAERNGAEQAEEAAS